MGSNPLGPATEYPQRVSERSVESAFLYLRFFELGSRLKWAVEEVEELLGMIVRAEP